MSDGIPVCRNGFYHSHSLREIVSVHQPVNLTARSVIREQGQAMVKAPGGGIDMQALCVSLNPLAIPGGAAHGVLVRGGPGTLTGTGGRGQGTPYMFEMGLQRRLNRRLAEYVRLTGTHRDNLDPSLVSEIERLEGAGHWQKVHTGGIGK